MAIDTLESKPSATTFTTETKPSGTISDLQEKTGSGWNYDEDNLTYDAVTDPDTGLPVLYDSLGTNTSWNLESKPT